MKTTLLEFLQDQYITEDYISKICDKLVQISFERNDNWYKIKFIHPKNPKKWQICTLYLDGYSKSEFIYILATNEMILVNSSNYKTTLKVVLDNMPNYAIYELSKQIVVPVPVYETCQFLYNKSSLRPYYESFKVATSKDVTTFTIIHLDKAGMHDYSEQSVLSVSINNISYMHKFSNCGITRYTAPLRCLDAAYFNLKSTNLPELQLLIRSMAPNSTEANFYSKNVIDIVGTNKRHFN